MQSGHRRDAIKMVRGKVIFADIRQLIIDIGELFRARPGDTNHLGRKINCRDVPGAFRQLARKRTSPTANLQGMAAFFWNMLQKKLVVVVVMRPAFTVEHGQAIKIFGDDGHLASDLVWSAATVAAFPVDPIVVPVYSPDKSAHSKKTHCDKICRRSA